MLWLKAFHIIAVICWMAALFYLPRLFVYHAMSQDKISRERFVIMERKLYRGIATPSMIATIILGFWTASYNWAYYQSSLWFWGKLSLVALLVIYHFVCRHFMRSLAQDEDQHNHVFFRWFNEAPVLLLIPIVLLVILKPHW
ncbi:protoporphyrinogen oxidase HemJ [uncultured Pseudoteredinibacter sp.]|uniref:protoporphyrinogen oxidase HemJ n=1 Tax=uncultured Pseudoteredinibacter sp. TaxID=1641701 RepID=UPI00260BDB5C|nr:protoporphyrinogen oxidase HemJ [uncultured Pseudoteredinibacter sp.]